VSTWHVIDDTTPDRELFPSWTGRGLELPAEPSYAGVAEPFPDALLVPRGEWQGRIAERTERKQRLRDLVDAAGLPVKDQGSTNYCWVNAPAYCTEVVRVLQGEPTVVLSPASAGAQIKGFRNVGGWGKEALEWIVAHGLVPVAHWPANAIDRRYKTPENLTRARSYRVDEWWVLEPRNLDQLVSCLLRNIPVAVGYKWWGHEVTGLDPVWLDGEVALLIANSWGPQWGTNGFGVLQGRRLLPDDAVAPRTAIAA
jgi:hypothetical protein